MNNCVLQLDTPVTYSPRKTKMSDEPTPEAASRSGLSRDESSDCPPPFLPGRCDNNYFNKWRRNLNNDNEISRVAEDKLNGAAYQVDGELGKNANQFNQNTKYILQLVMRESDSPHLFEPILKELTPTALKELEEPSDSDSKEKLIKYEICMNKRCSEVVN